MFNYQQIDTNLIGLLGGDFKLSRLESYIQKKPTISNKAIDSIGQKCWQDASTFRLKTCTYF
jgi:uncharacterized protein YneF (UPF0154 family)